jgi:hypothetical protein
LSRSILVSFLMLSASSLMLAKMSISHDIFIDGISMRTLYNTFGRRDDGYTASTNPVSRCRTTIRPCIRAGDERTTNCLVTWCLSIFATLVTTTNDDATLYIVSLSVPICSSVQICQW